MCLLWSTNWGFISQKTTFFMVTAVKTSNLTNSVNIVQKISSCLHKNLLNHLGGWVQAQTNRYQWHVVTWDNYLHKPQIESRSVNPKSVRRMTSSGMLRRVALVSTYDSEELSASFIRVTRIGVLGKTLAVASVDEGGAKFLRNVGSYKSHTA
jgi:hypothetical protein